MTAYFAWGFGLFFSLSCFRAFAKAFWIIAYFASSDNSALESILVFYLLKSSAGFCFYLFSFAIAALIVFYIKAYFASSESSLISVSGLDFIANLFSSSFNALAKASLTILYLSSSESPSLFFAADEDVKFS